MSFINMRIACVCQIDPPVKYLGILMGMLSMVSLPHLGCSSYPSTPLDSGFYALCTFINVDFNKIICLIVFIFTSFRIIFSFIFTFTFYVIFIYFYFTLYVIFIYLCSHVSFRLLGYSFLDNSTCVLFCYWFIQVLYSFSILLIHH